MRIHMLFRLARICVTYSLADYFCKRYIITHFLSLINLQTYILYEVELYVMVEIVRELCRRNFVARAKRDEVHIDDISTW